MKHRRQGVRSHGVGLLLAWCCCYYQQGLPEYHCTISSVHALAGSSNRKSKSNNTSKGKGKRKDGSSGGGGGFGSSSSTTMANPIHTPDTGPEIGRLVHFLTAHNAKGLTNVEIGYHTHTGMRGLFGTQKFKKKQIICQIPSDCALVLNDPTTTPTETAATAAAAATDQTTTTPAQRGWNFLQMYVKDTNAHQFWSPYLETLPKQLQQFNDDDDDDAQETDKDDANASTQPQPPTIDPTPDFFIDEDLELFEYPRVIRLANERKAQLESVLAVAAAAASSSSSDTTRSIAMEELQYATWLTSSRSFKLTLPDDDDDADNADDEDENTTANGNEENGVMLRTDPNTERKAVYVMVPFLDMANHNSDQANCKLTLIDPEKDDAWFALEATRPIAPGKELTLCYGETGTESSVELLLNYGFVPTTNKIDPLMLTKAKQKDDDENATDTIPTLEGWMTTLDEDRTMLQMAIDTKDPVLQKILNFRIRLKESY